MKVPFCALVSAKSRQYISKIHAKNRNGLFEDAKLLNGWSEICNPCSSERRYLSHLLHAFEGLTSQWTGASLKVDHSYSKKLEVRNMTRRFFPLWVVLALASCVCASPANGKSIDPALLAKANAGDAGAQYQLGNAYNYGDKVRRDYAQALIWYRKGAEQGNADSQFQLGGLYHFGHGVPQDEAQSFSWTMKAAEQGLLDAEFFLSTCYTEGWGVPQDDAEGAVWLRKAAEQGHVTSQSMLGWAYAAGDIGGIPQDYSEAYFWLDIAASGEVTRKERKEALKRRDDAASHLTPADQSRIQERVRQWAEDHPPKQQ